MRITISSSEVIFSDKHCNFEHGLIVHRSQSYLSTSSWLNKLTRKCKMFFWQMFIIESNVSLCIFLYTITLYISSQKGTIKLISYYRVLFCKHHKLALSLYMRFSDISVWKITWRNLQYYSYIFIELFDEIVRKHTFGKTHYLKFIIWILKNKKSLERSFVVELS